MAIFIKNYKKIILAFFALASASFVFAEKYVVQKGDTLYSISRKYNISLETLLKENSLTKDSVLKIGDVLYISEAKSAVSAGTSVSAGSTENYVVQKGDTFSSISKKYGMTVDELCLLNGLSKDSVLKIGQKLSVKKSPSKVNGTGTALNKSRTYDTYTVQKGDTLYRIAKVNGITVDELKSLNNLNADSVLKAGEKLKIPVTIVDTKNASLPDLHENDPRTYSTKKGDSSLAWPVKNPVVTYMKGKVSGVQLSAEKNESVTAIRAGTVMYVGNYRGYGQVVFVQSKTGHIYTYSGLGSIKVKKGDYVVFGDVIGTAGTDSIKGTSQICLMVFQKSKPIDPATAPRG